MNDFEAYRLYVSIKNHFSSETYDYFKYNGKNKGKIDSFNKRKDKIFFQKLAKHESLKDFLVSNFVEDNKLWVKDLAYSEKAELTYKNWLKKKQSLTYFFKKDLDKLDHNFDKNFQIENNNHPILLKLFLRKEITLETICILSILVNFVPYWNKKLEYDPTWKDVKLKMLKYIPFMEYDKEKYKKICVDKYTN